MKLNQGAFIARHASAAVNNSSSNASTLSSGLGETYSSTGEGFSENTASAPCGSEENSVKPLCTIKETEEDHETTLIEKLKTSASHQRHHTET